MKDKTPKIKTHTHTLTHTYTNADTTLLSDAYMFLNLWADNILPFSRKHNNGNKNPYHLPFCNTF